MPIQTILPPRGKKQKATVTSVPNTSSSPAFTKKLHKAVRVRLMKAHPSYRVFLGALVLVLIVYASFVRPPSLFPAGTVISVEEGMTIQEASEALKSTHVIRSTSMFRGIVEVFGGNKGILAGDYVFKERATVASVARALIQGDYGVDPLAVTIPEGASVLEIADILERSLDERFDKELFIQSALPYEGYLFPDTYFFLPTVSIDTLIRTMRDTFESRVEEIYPDIEAFGKPLSEVVIMASLLEKEAHDYEVRRAISGVLWNRISIGMPLQVDAVYPYIIGKNTYEVSLKDLDSDSPYNTYKYKGLPIGPIANPGLDSLKAAVLPEASDYYYYLADRSGNTYFSETFEEHKEYKRLYIN